MTFDQPALLEIAISCTASPHRSMKTYFFSEALPDDTPYFNPGGEAPSGVPEALPTQQNRTHLAKG